MDIISPIPPCAVAIGIAIASITPIQITNICTTSVQITAAIPPNTVYAIANTPIMRIAIFGSAPVIIESASAGPYITTAVCNPLDNRKINAISVLDLDPNRFSRYS